jgi:AcrR family transcriptional regulator
VTDPRIRATRRAVLGAALELVAERGFAAATIEAVSERSGVARSTIYRRWPEPNRLFLEAFWPMTEGEAALVHTGDTVHDLHAYLADYARRMNDPVYFSALVALIDRAARDDDFAAMHRALTDARRSRAASVIAEGIEAGTLASAIDLGAALEALTAPFLYIRMIRHDVVGDTDIERVLGDFLDRFGADPAPASTGRRA